MAAEEIGRMQSVLTADNAQYDRAMDASATKATATSRAIAKAAKDASAAQEIASKYAGDAVTAEGVKQVELARKLTAISQERSKLSNLIKKDALGEAEASRALASVLNAEADARRKLGEAAAAQAEKERIAAIQQQRDYEAYLARGTGKLVEGHGFTNQMASSTVLRGGGLRSEERFLSSIPGATRLIQPLALALGGAGLAGALVEMGEKGYEAFQKVRHSAEASRAAFSDLHDKSQIRIDDLAIENQKIQDQIDKISGHPSNGMAMALLEAKKMADALVLSLQEDRKQLDALFKENSTGTFGKALSLIGIGPDSTGTQEKQLLADQKNLMEKVRAARATMQDELAKAPDDKGRQAARAKFNASLREDVNAQIESYKREDGRLAKEESDSRKRAEAASEGGSPYATPVDDNSKKRANIQGRRDQLQDFLSTQTLNESIYSGNAALGKAKQDKANDAGGGTGVDHSAELRFKAMEAYVAQWKTETNVSAQAEFDYWAAQRTAFASGSQQYNQVVEKQAQLATEGARKFAEGVAKIKREMLKQGEDTGKAAADRSVVEVYDAYARSLQQMDKARDTNVDASNEIAAIKARAAATEEETRINEAAGRTITRQDALRQIAILHAQQYSEQIQAINAKASQVANASYMSDPEKASQLRQLGEQGASLEAQRQATMARDQAQMQPPDSSAIVGAKDALNELADSAKDSAGQLKNFIGQTLSSFNSTAVDMLTRRHYPGDHTIRNAGADLFRSGTGALLQKGEGELASMFGFGAKNKPTGTAADPLHVVMASVPSINIPGVPQSLNSLGATALGGNPMANQQNLFGSILSTILHPGGSSDGFASSALSAAQAGADTGSGVSDMMAGLAGFAEGTPPLSEDTMAIVGEKGPELAYLSKGTGIVPNHKLNNIGGDSHHYSIAVDARGATDPAMVRKMVNDGISAAAPHIAAAAVSRVSENRKRGPATRG